MSDAALLQALGAVVAVILAPAATYALKAWRPGALSGLGVPVNGALSLAVYLAGWWVMGADRGRLAEYLLAACASAVIGSSAVALRRRAVERRDALGRPLER